MLVTQKADKDLVLLEVYDKLLKMVKKKMGSPMWGKW